MATPQLFKEFIVRFKQGERIYSAGDPGMEMYIVQNGSVEVFTEAGGVRISLAVMEKGDFFGEMALMESAPHSTCAEALSDCDLIEINSTLFDKMIKSNIEIAVRMLRKLSMRLRDAERRLEALAVPAQASAGQAAAANSPQTAQIPSPAARAATLAPGQARARTTRQPAAKSAAARPRPANCHAAFVSEEGQELFHLVGDRAAIGRFDPVTGLKPEVDLSSLDLNRSVSRHHARLTREGGVYMVTEEVGALNGTFINGKKLLSGKPARIADGDVLNVGIVKLVFKEIGA